MSEFRHKLIDLKTDDNDLIINAFKEIIQQTVESNDKEFEEGIMNVGRFIIGLVAAQRIAFKIFKSIETDNKSNYDLIN